MSTSTIRHDSQLPGSETIGWQCEDGMIHLLPEHAFAAVMRSVHEAREGFPIKPSTLWERLAALGLVTGYEKGHQTVKRTHGGKRYRVVEVVRQALDDEGIAPDGSGPPSPPAGADRAHRTLSESGAKAHESRPSGASQVAALTEKIGERPDCPGSAEVEGYPRETFSSLRRDLNEEDREYVTTPPPSGDIGAMGAPEGIGREIYNDNGWLQPQTHTPAVAVYRGGAGALGALPEHVAFKLVRSADALPELARVVERAGIVGLDLETTGLSSMHDRPRLVQLALPGGLTFVIDLFATRTLGPLAEALGHVELVGHHLAFDLAFLAQHGGVTASRAFDTMLASQIADAGVNLHAKDYHTLASVLSRMLGISLDKSERTSDWAGELSTAQLEYAARDVAHLLPLRDALDSALTAQSLGATVALECDLLPVLVEMARTGVPVCVDELEVVAVVRDHAVRDARERLHSTLGIINPDSPRQVLSALRAAGLDVDATNAEALARHRDHPAVRDLAAMRTSAKIAADARGLAVAARAQPDGRVRPHWHQIGAPTGRMSTSDPNVLGLPKERAMRACIVAPAGRALVVADYSAIELRVLAQVTGDQTLAQIFRDGGDPHRAHAARLLRKAPGDITTEERKRAKAVNFGFAFGMGAPRFVKYAAKDYGVNFAIEEAQRFRFGYLNAYPCVARWQQETRAQMGLGVRTIGGRLRAFIDQASAYTERLNLPIQGTAADGMKAAMVLVAPRLAALDARIVLAVHDELVVEAPHGASEDVRRLVEGGMREGMRRFVTSVPIVVEASVGRTWGGAS